MAYNKQLREKDYIINLIKITGLKLLNNGTNLVNPELNKPKSHTFEWQSKNEKHDFDLDSISVKLLNFNSKTPKIINDDNEYNALYNDKSVPKKDNLLYGFPLTLTDFYRNLNIKITKTLSKNTFGFVFTHTPYFKARDNNYDVLYLITVKLNSGDSLQFLLGAYGIGGEPFSQGDVNLPKL